jgi:radical SAM superfamily enzyme YgiQ (UPF0313 family)
LRVLLINTNTKDDVLAAPPIGLAYVASAASEAGHQVRVLDLCFQHRVRHSLEREIRGFLPEIVGLSIRNLDNANFLHPISYVPSATEIAGTVRRITDAPVILGGTGASICPEELLRELAADFVVKGHGEEPFVRMLEGMEQGEVPKGVPGVGCKESGSFLLVPPERAWLRPGPSRLHQWVPMAPYRAMGCSYPVQTKRGCRHACVYCVYNQVLEGHGLQLRDPVEVVDELEEVRRRVRPDTFVFVDAVFNDPVEHSVLILEEILRRPWKARFTAIGVSPRGLTSKHLDLMWRAGFRSFMSSPDTASGAVLESYRKGFSIDDLARAAEALNRTRFTVFWYFLLGGPGETARTVQESLDFILERLGPGRRPPYHIAFFFLGIRLHPHTPIWRIAVEEGLIGERSDPLRPLWYVSPELVLEPALERLYRLSQTHDWIVPGTLERYFPWTRWLKVVGRLLPLPKPYWRHTWGFSRLMRRCGIESSLRPEAAALAVRSVLERQKADSGDGA